MEIEIIELSNGYVLYIDDERFEFDNFQDMFDTINDAIQIKFNK